MERTERLEARISGDMKSLVKEAAVLRGRSLSEFVVSAAVEKAEEVMAEEGCYWKLNAEESVAFVQRLLEDREPNSRFKQAFADHEEWVRG